MKVDYGKLRVRFWTRRPGKQAHLCDGSWSTLEPEFDWPDERWVLDHFETRQTIGIENGC